jgi:hypothetical protein
MVFDHYLVPMFSKGPKAAYPWVLKGGSGNFAEAWNTFSVCMTAVLRTLTSSNDLNGACRMNRDALGDTAEEEVTEPAPAV